ncbi:MAG: hypothetical protein GEU82_10885 [Luteitalea sp.]|nr:hypothetical protein [Luteitalea sp.]
MTLARAAGLGLAASLTLVIWALGSVVAAAYLIGFALATLPGLPLGFRLFGRRHAGGWIAGMLFGYVITTLSFWAIVFTGNASNVLFASAWALASAVAWAGAWFGRWIAAQPLVALPRWTARDTAALLLVLQLVPVLTGPALARVGSLDADGNRLYRAYFTADFVWHAALVAELAKHSQPPRNPYLASEPVHYYWTYFVVPATLGPMTGADVELSLKVNAVGTALLFVSALYLAAWSALPTFPFTVASALFLTIVASSAEGLAAMAYVLGRGQSLDALRNLNVDALSRGLNGLRIDNLPRAMWYTPHHSLAYALGVLALPVAIAAGVRARPLAILVTGMALGASVMINPLVGAMFSAVYAVAIAVDGFRTGSGFRGLFRHALAVIPVALALGWIALNRIAEGAGSTLHFGLADPASNTPISSFLLSFGPILPLVAAGLVPLDDVPFRRMVGAGAGLLISVLVMHLVVMKVDLFWIGFRTGHLFFVFAPAVVARGLIVLFRSSARVAWGAAVVVLLVGLPTTVIDAFNAQDVENDRMGPGFHWTVKLTPPEQDGLRWIREHTPIDAVVQAEPIVRGRETWSLIPTWGQRRMAGGEPISLMHVSSYDTLSGEVNDIYQLPDPVAAWRLARQLGIDFLYVDATERGAYPNVKKFDHDPDHFAVAFRNAEVTIYAVK